MIYYFVFFLENPDYHLARLLVKEVNSGWQQLRDKGNKREQDLKNAIAAHQYLADVSDAQMWIEVRLHCINALSVKL